MGKTWLWFRWRGGSLHTFFGTWFLGAPWGGKDKVERKERYTTRKNRLEKERLWIGMMVGGHGRPVARLRAPQDPVVAANSLGNCLHCRKNTRCQVFRGGVLGGQTVRTGK